MFGIGIAKAKSLETTKLFDSYVHLLTDGEMDIHRVYSDWIKGYASDKYSKEKIVLFEMLEKLTAHYTDEQKQHIVDIYVTCSRYELAFWKLSWNIST